MQLIKQALASFIPSAETIPGRMNMFQFSNFQFMVDYAHNPAGLQAVGEFISKMQASPKVGIIAGVGDRRNEDIIEMGRLAAQIFDEIIIRIDKDLRDRPQEQIINLLKEGITLVNTDKITTIIPDEKEVINFAIEHAREGSIIVHFSEKVLATLSYISQLQQKERIASTKINNSSDGQTTESAAIIEQQLQMGHS